MALSMWTKWRKNIKIAFRLVTLYWCWSLLILPLLHSYCDGKHAKWELHILQKHNSISLCNSRQIEWLSRKNEEMSRKNTNYASAISKQEERIHFFLWICIPQAMWFDFKDGYLFFGTRPRRVEEVGMKVDVRQCQRYSRFNCPFSTFVFDLNRI